MNQIFVTNPKGGCGKTTIATHLASHYSNNGAKVLLVDHDAQKSSSDWYDCRPKKYLSMKLIASSVNTPVSTKGADVVIHDMPAAWTLEHVEEILHSDDKILIPVLSSPTDIKAALRFIMALNRSGILEQGIKVGLVANKVKSNTSYHQIQQSFLERMDFPVVGSLRDTQNYIKTMDKGLTVFDFPISKVKNDLSQWQPILNWLNAIG